MMNLRKVHSFLIAAVLVALQAANVYGVNDVAKFDGSEIQTIAERIKNADLNNFMQTADSGGSYTFNTAPSASDKNNVAKIWTDIKGIKGRSAAVHQTLVDVFFLKVCAYFIHEYADKDIEAQSQRTFIDGLIISSTTIATTKLTTPENAKAQLLVYVKGQLAKISTASFASEALTYNGATVKTEDMQLEALCTAMAKTIAAAHNLMAKSLFAFKKHGLGYRDLQDAEFDDPDTTGSKISFATFVRRVIDNVDTALEDYIANAIQRIHDEDSAKTTVKTSGTGATGFITNVKTSLWNAIRTAANYVTGRRTDTKLTASEAESLAS